MLVRSLGDSGSNSFQLKLIVREFAKLDLWTTSLNLLSTWRMGAKNALSCTAQTSSWRVLPVKWTGWKGRSSVDQSSSLVLSLNRFLKTEGTDWIVFFWCWFFMAIFAKTSGVHANCNLFYSVGAIPLALGPNYSGVSWKDFKFHKVQLFLQRLARPKD